MTMTVNIIPMNMILTEFCTSLVVVAVLVVAVAVAVAVLVVAVVVLAVAAVAAVVVMILSYSILKQVPIKFYPNRKISFNPQNI